MPKKLLFALAVLYTLALTAASLISLKGIPELGTDMDDKIYHVLAYFILMWLWILQWNKPVMPSRFWYTALGCIIFGIIIELVQHRVNANRTSDVMDVLANLVGVFLGLLSSRYWIGAQR